MEQLRQLVRRGPSTGSIGTDIAFIKSVKLSNTIGNNDYKLRNLTFGSSAGAFVIWSGSGRKLIFKQSADSITNSSPSLQNICVTTI